MRTVPLRHIPDLGLSPDVLGEAAERFGTPLYVYDAGRLEADWNLLNSALPEGVEVLYSVKANPAAAVIAEFARLGAGFEISSPGELLALAAAGADPSKAVLLGPGKTPAELEEAVKMGVGLVAVESIRELHDLDSAAKRAGMRAKALLRINPGAGRGAQRMAGVTQFGMDPGQAAKALALSLETRNLEVRGVHGFLGTRLLGWRTLSENLSVVLAAAENLQRRTGARLDTVDLGGGFGVPLYGEERELDLESLKTALAGIIGGYVRAHPWTGRLLVESGRFLAARAGVMLTRVVDVKTVMGSLFVIVDGGLHVIGGRDGYIGAKIPPMRVLGRERGRQAEVTVCGPLCTPADRLASRVIMTIPETGDLIALYVAGAYGLTASAGLFLSRGYPAEVMLKRGKLFQIRSRLSAGIALLSQNLGKFESQEDGDERSAGNN